MKRLAAASTLVLLASTSGCLAATLVVGGAGVSASPICGSTTAGSPAVLTGKLPEKIGAYTRDQITNAAQIIIAGQALGVSALGQGIAVMTALGESSLHNLDRGDSVGPDSRGLFQQRDNGAWGTYTDRMNPRTAATNFYKALLAVNGWDQMEPTLAAHAVQRNANPWHYQSHWNDAVTIIATLSDQPDLASQMPAGDAPCSPNDNLTGIPGNDQQACSITPDPTTGNGCLTPRMDAIATYLKDRGWSISCWDSRTWNPTSDHPHGRACDAFPGQGGILPSAAQKARGDALAAQLQASAQNIGLYYLIWYGRIWSTKHTDQGWRPYNGGGIHDPTDITGGHYDHIHISVY